MALYSNLNNERGLISISGEDAQKFLQGIISNDIKKLPESGLINTYLLTPQGKYLYDFFISMKENNYVIDCEKARLQDLIKKLSIYKLRSKVDIKDASNEFKIYQFYEKVDADHTFPDPRDASLGFRVYLQNNNDILSAHEPADESEYLSRRIDALVAEGGKELQVDGDYPLQFRMIETNAVDFKKGCYVGQEVTARTHHRGNIRKTLFRMKYSEAPKSLPPHNADITVNGEKIGRLVATTNKNLLILADIEKFEIYTVSGAPISCIEKNLFNYQLLTY